MALGRFWRPFDPFRVLTTAVLQPAGLLPRRMVHEDRETRRIARVLGGIVFALSGGLILLLPGLSWLAWTLTGLVGVMILLDAAFDFCALCLVVHHYTRLTAIAGCRPVRREGKSCPSTDCCSWSWSQPWSCSLASSCAGGYAGPLRPSARHLAPLPHPATETTAPVTLLNFSSPLCGTCRRVQKPLVEKVSAQFANQVAVLEVDALAQADLARPTTCLPSRARSSSPATGCRT